MGGFGGGGFGGNPYGFPSPPGFPDLNAFQKFLQDYLNQMQEWTKQQAQATSANAIPGCPTSGIGDRIGSGGGFPTSGGGVGTGGGDGSVGAVASGSIGPGGGYGSTKVFPSSGGPGLGDRFGSVGESSGPFPAPGGGSVGISSFSSSSSSDVDGKKTSQKSATVSVNDNGKVTTYTSHDP
ncbi:uncharacterized protein [Halyomorpha halys]|uniref:uncharacterized protein n=1 Tax=Halyomorpha halys TaxID=286706 RepID=UPI0034D1AEDE